MSARQCSGCYKNEQMLGARRRVGRVAAECASSIAFLNGSIANQLKPAARAKAVSRSACHRAPKPGGNGDSTQKPYTTCKPSPLPLSCASNVEVVCVVRDSPAGRPPQQPEEFRPRTAAEPIDRRDWFKRFG